MQVSLTKSRHIQFQPHPHLVPTIMHLIDVNALLSRSAWYLMKVWVWVGEVLSLNNVLHMQWKDLKTMSSFGKKLCQQVNDSCYTLHAYSQSILFYLSFITSLKLPFFSIKNQFKYTKIISNYIKTFWCLKP